MASKKSFTESQVLFEHKGGNHPGFEIKGYKLRWLHQGVEIRRAGRMWSVVKLSDFPESVRKKIIDCNPSWIDGDTIRRREQVLAVAPLERVAERRKELKHDQSMNEAVMRGKGSPGGLVQTTDTGMQEGVNRLGAGDFK